MLTGTGDAAENFYPRPPGGGRPKHVIFAFVSIKFLSTPSGWRATTEPQDEPEAPEISIHALRVEGDPIETLHIFEVAISIHALRVEGDLLQPL